MLRRTKLGLAATGAAGALGALLLVPGQLARTADHLDPPSRTDPAVDPTPDIAADIADIYAFHDDNFVYILDTFGGPSDPSLPAFYDPRVLHTINISTTAPASSPEISMRFRFGPGQNPGEVGVQAVNVPGVPGEFVGPVEQVLNSNGAMLFAGLRDDPFFFDSQGLRESRTTGTLAFNNQRSFFFGKNITVIAVAIPRSQLPADTTMHIWSTSARLGGQL